MGACASVTIAVTSMLSPQGDVTVVVVGGVDSTVCNKGLGDFSVPRVLSTNSTPDQASRPRARRRDGFVFSKGVGVVMVGGVDSPICNNRLGGGLYLEYYQQIQPQINLQGRGLAVVMVLWFPKGVGVVLVEDLSQAQ